MAKNSPFWLDGRATIVVLPSGDEGLALFALAENWSEVGLLGPALWVEPRRVSTREGEPVSVDAVVLGNDRSGNHVQIVVDLFEQLAKENLSTVRLIQVRSVTPTTEFDEIQNDVARQVEEAIYTVIPGGDTRNNRKAHLGFQVVNLIAAPSAHTVEERLQDVLAHGGATTIVASPEDRSSPWSTDAFVRNGKKFVGFVLMHVATVGGLWKGLPVGSLELFEREGSAGESVYLTRVFVSSVLTDGLARRVAAQVLRDTIDPQVIETTAPSGAAYIADGVKDEYIDSMVKYLMALDDAVMDYHRPAELEDPEKANVGIWAALESFTRFAWTKSLRIPYWAYRFVRNKLAVGVQKRLQGDDGFAEVERELREEPLDMRDRTILTRQAMLADHERAARTANAAPVRLSEIRSTPYLWASIREMIFGSLDGGADLSEKGFPRVDTTIRPIFRSPDDLFPSPDAVFELRRSPSFPQGIPSEINWENYGDAFEMGQELATWAKAADAELMAINSELGDFAIELSEIDSRLSDLKAQLRENDALEDLEDGSVKLLSIADAKLLDRERLASPSDAALAESEPDGSDQEPTARLDDATVEQVEPLVSLEELVREHKSLTGRKAELFKAVPEAEEKSLAAQDEVVLRQEVLDGYRKWQETAGRSFLWKLRSRMEKAVALGHADLKSFQNGLESIAPHQSGTLSELRRKFHKSLLFTHSIVMLVAGIVAATGWLFWSTGDSQAQDLIPIATEQQVALQDDLGDSLPVNRQNLPALVGDADVLRTDIDEQVGEAANAVAADPADDAAASELEALESKQEQVKQYQDTLSSLAAAYPLMDLGAELLFWTAIGTPAVLLLGLLLLFIPYHRKWAAFERSVEVQLRNLERIEKGSAVCRTEIQRMTALHGQAILWLKILATVTHTPWQVKPSWLESGLKTLDLDSLPFAMRIAQADEGDTASFATLVDSAQTKLHQPGWRKQAFDRLVTGIQNATGRSGKAFSLEALDQDLPHASNNSRSLLQRYMSDDNILQKVAVQYLKPLIEDLQGKAMANARPEVVQAEDDPLIEFRGDIEGVDEYSNRQKWDDFLSHTLTLNNGEADPVTALSVMSIAPEKIMEGEHENVSSYALIPEHVSSKLDPALSAGLIKQTYDAKIARPLDSVIRVDIVGPVNLRALRVVSGERSSVLESSPEESGNSTLVKGAFAQKASPAS